MNNHKLNHLLQTDSTQHRLNALSFGNALLIGLLATLIFLSQTFFSDWESKLYNVAFIEVPPATSVKSLNFINDALAKEPNIQEIIFSPEEETAQAIQSLLGEEAAQIDLPAPTLIKITIQDDFTETIDRLQTDLSSIHSHIHIRTLDQNLQDLDNIRHIFKPLLGLFSLISLMLLILTFTQAPGLINKANASSAKLIELLGASRTSIQKQLLICMLKRVAIFTIIGLMIAPIVLYPFLPSLLQQLYTFSHLQGFALVLLSAIIILTGAVVFYLIKRFYQSYRQVDDA